MYVGAYDQYDLIKPRRLTLNFVGGPKVRLEAETMGPLDLEGRGYYLESFFWLNDEALLSIAQKELLNIVIWDNRTEQSLTLKPYKYILKEQWECIFKELLE